MLQQLSAGHDDPPDAVLFYREFHTIVGSVITLAKPLSIKSLAGLLRISEEDICDCIQPLSSVLQIPTDIETPLRTLHLSFAEFLFSHKAQDQPFGVDKPATHRMLLTNCLALLSGPDGLRENICNLKYPGQQRCEIDQVIIENRLSPEIQYACRYWVHHAQNWNSPVRDDDAVHLFLQKHFRHWLEALSLMDAVTEAIMMLEMLENFVSVRVLQEDL